MEERPQQNIPPQENVPAPVNQASSKKWMFVSVGIVVLLAVLGSGYYVLMRAGFEVSIDKPTELTVEILKNMEYYVLFANREIRLVDGYYKDESSGYASALEVQIYKNKTAFGDLDKDDENEAAVILDSTGGGSGSFRELVVIDSQEGQPTQIASEPLGDRTVINSLEIRSSEIVLDIVTHGPEDPMCCPTDHKIVKYRLSNDELVKISDLPVDETASWKTYIWEEGGVYVPPLTFRYPLDWAVEIGGRYATPGQQERGERGDVVALYVFPSDNREKGTVEIGGRQMPCNLIDECVEVLPHNIPVKPSSQDETVLKVFNLMIKTFAEPPRKEIEKPVIFDILPLADEISSPLSISGNVLGDWVLEGEFGVALKDSNGRTLTNVVAKVEGDWRAGGYIPFTAVLVFDEPETEAGTLVFIEAVARDGEIAETMEVPVHFASTSIDTSDWKTYRNEELGFEFRYPGELSVERQGPQIVLRHSINYVHPDLCDFKDGRSQLEKLVDFNMSMRIVGEKLTGAFFDGSEYLVSEGYLLDDGTIKEQPGFIGRESIGSLSGYYILSGIEGCGNTTFYYQLTDDKTLVVVNTWIAELSGAATTKYEEYRSLPGVISIKEHGRISRGVLESFKFIE